MLVPAGIIRLLHFIDAMVRESRSMAAAATARAMAVATARAMEVARGGGDVRERDR